MSLRRYANKRDKSEPAIFAALRSMGCLIYPTDKPTDALCLVRGRIHLIECKTGKGKLTEDQKDFVKLWPVWVLRSVDDAAAFVTANCSREAA